MMLPDFVVIGAMKSGTTELHEQLDERSGVHMSTPKEPNFFSDDSNFARGLDAYRKCFAGAREGQIVGESSTHYSKLPTYPQTVERLASVLPDARFVYLLRDPIERIVSQYVHELSQGEVSGSFEQAVSHERYVAYSQYARQLSPFLERFGRERILLVGFERMLARGDEELARVCRFVGDPTEDPPRWRDSAGANPGSQRRLPRPWQDALLRRGPVRLLADRVPQAARDWWNRGRGIPRPSVSEALRARLAARIDADLASLDADLGRPLRCASWREEVLRAPLDWR